MEAATEAVEAAKGQQHVAASSADRVSESNVIEEGKATVLLENGQEAFYNPAQVVNRDMSVAVLRQFVKLRAEEVASGKLKVNVLKNSAPKCRDAAALAEKQAADPSLIRVLEGLAASGLRAIRYALEVPGIWRVDANDIDKRSVEAIQRNVDRHGPEAAKKVKTSESDARVLMIQRAGCYDVVDLDPYGSPTQLLDSAVQAVAEGGLLMVTATDMAVLCGNNGEACWAKYGSYPLHKPYCHEMALRIMLACLQSHAARHKRIIVPLVSLSIDFYIRIFVRVHTSPLETKAAASKLVYVYQSTGCDSFYLQRLGRKEERGKNNVKYAPGRGPTVPETCPETGSGFNVGGPFWGEPLHDVNFVREMLDEIKENNREYPQYSRLVSILTTVLEELPDAPFYYSSHDLSKLLRTPPPPQDTFRSALVNAGYRVSSTHANALGVKTDAPPEVVWDVMRAWARDHGSKKLPQPGSAMEKILSKKSNIAVSFKKSAAALSASRVSKLTRFPGNPEANWGPKRKHTRQAVDADGPPVKRVKREEASEPQAAELNGTGNGSLEQDIAANSSQKPAADLAQEPAAALPGDEKAALPAKA